MENQVHSDYDLRLQRLLYGNLSYDTFRSEASHMYHSDGDYLFISKVMKAHLVTELWDNNERVKALYMLATIDYISWKNDVPFSQDYESLRTCKLKIYYFQQKYLCWIGFKIAMRIETV